MAFDFKKKYKEFYMPKNKPVIVNVPEANYIAVRGEGNPNEEGGSYQQAIGVLYAIAYTLRMSYKTDYKIEGFFEYVVPPLEGFWWQDDIDGVNYADKDSFHWISVIRLPDFVNEKDFEWAIETATKKKKIDCSSAEFLTIDEGLCVQIMHLGSFDDEPATVALMDEYLKQNGYANDMNSQRLHHEIYLSDARKVAPEKWKTVKLMKGSLQYKNQIIEMIKEWKSYNDTHNANTSPWAIFKNDYDDFEYYLNTLEISTTDDGFVPDSTFFCLDEDRDTMVGAVNIRHYLNEYLLKYGGHIGDGIRPSERRKGYATKMISLALEECKKLGMDKVLLVCDKDNIGSVKSIINNGGVLENEVLKEGKLIQRYWIML